MKKIIIAIIVIALAAGLGVFVVKGLQANMEKDTEFTYDESFINDLKNGLMTRWAETDLKTDEESDKDFGEKLIKSELDQIEKYATLDFKDATLKQKAVDYIDILKQQQEAMGYFDTNRDKYVELYGDAAEKRATALKSFIEDYNITFPDKYADKVDSVMHPKTEQ